MITTDDLTQAITTIGREAGNNVEGLALAEILRSPRTLDMMVRLLNAAAARNMGGIVRNAMPFIVGERTAEITITTSRARDYIKGTRGDRKR